jgi:hypothetical protein
MILKLLWQHHNILPLAVAKGHDITVSQLNVATTSNLLAVQSCSVGAVQVDEIWFDLAYFVSILIRFRNVPKLNNSVLFADTRVLQLKVDNGLIATHEPAAARIQVYCVDHVFGLEDEHAPLLFT